MEFPFLQQTSLSSALSLLGQSIYLPQGIFYWSGRAAKEAEINGTAGVAQDDDGVISHLKIAEMFVGERIMQRMPRAGVFGYSPIEGFIPLREKWLKKICAFRPELEKFASLPVVTNGITHSISIASRLVLERGETIITANKSWENYEHIFTDLQGVKIKTFQLFNDKGEFNIENLIEVCDKVAKAQNKVVLLLNFPHNQTGFMPTPQECKQLAQRMRELCKKMPSVPFVILLDDAYEGYVYDDTGQKFSLISTLFAQLPNLTIMKMDGISKVMLAYGYRVGFLTVFINSLDGAAFNDEVLKGLRIEIGSKIGGFVRGEISQVNHHGQILADALMDDLEEIGKERSAVIAMLKERWKIMMKALEDCYSKYGKQKIWADPCNSGFFCYMNLAKGISPIEIAEKLLKEKKVGIVPSEQGLRVAFCGVAKEKIPRMIEAVFETVYRQKVL